MNEESTEDKGPRPKKASKGLPPHKANRLGVPLNLPVELQDGRWLMIKKGHGKRMICIQVRKKGTPSQEPLVQGEVVYTVPDAKGQATVLEVLKIRGKKKIELRIVGAKRV